MSNPGPSSNQETNTSGLLGVRLTPSEFANPSAAILANTGVVYQQAGVGGLWQSNGTALQQILGGVSGAAKSSATPPSIFRSTYRALVDLGTDNGFGRVARLGEYGRNRLVIRLPADAPGNVQLGYKANPENIQDGNGPSFSTTLTPGQELLDVGSNGRWMVRGAVTTASVPANLEIEVEVECLV